MKQLLFLIIGFLLLASGRGADIPFEYKKVPKKYLYEKRCSIPDSIMQRKQLLSEKAFDLTTLLPKGFKRDGSVDYTTYIQKGIDKYKVVLFPDFPILVNQSGIALRDSSAIIFQKKSKLFLHPNDKKIYSILSCTNVKNVFLYNPVIIGDREKHIDKGGEWGFGIGIFSSEDVTVVNPQISNCWGDGIYIGRGKKTYNERIRIIGGHLDYNRRNGLSLISGKDITIAGTLISNTYGVLPMCGIDLEPNKNDEFLEKIRLDNIVTYNNAKSGAVIYLAYLIGKEQKEVSVDICNHIDDRSGISFRFGGGKDFYADTSIKKLSGYIRIENPIWKDAKEEVLIAQKTNYTDVYNFYNVVVRRGKKEDRKKSEKVKEELLTISSYKK